MARQEKVTCCACKRKCGGGYYADLVHFFTLHWREHDTDTIGEKACLRLVAVAELCAILSDSHS